MKIIIIFLFILLNLGCQLNRKVMIAYNTDDHNNRIVGRYYFNDGNLSSEVNYSESSNDSIRNYYNSSNKLYKSIVYHNVSKQSTLSYFIEIEYKNNIEIMTLYEPDSTIRYIKYTNRFDYLTVEKIYSWEFEPVRIPDTTNALILLYSIFYDKFNREITRRNYNLSQGWNYTETYTYKARKITYRTFGTFSDTIQVFKAPKNWKKLIRLGIEALSRQNPLEYKWVKE